MLLWTDTESTGLTPGKDKLLEVALVLTDDDLNELGDITILVTDNLAQHLDLMGKVVREMHVANGLIQDLYAQGPIHTVHQLSDWLRDCLWNLAPVETHEGSKTPDWTSDLKDWAYQNVVLAGSTVHFDRAMLAAEVPDLIKRVHYRNVDVSSIKELVKRWYPENVQYPQPEVKAHRALADIRNSIAELKWYRAQVFRDPLTRAPSVYERKAQPQVTTVSEATHFGITSDSLRSTPPGSTKQGGDNVYRLNHGLPGT